MHSMCIYTTQHMGREVSSIATRTLDRAGERIIWWSSETYVQATHSRCTMLHLSSTKVKCLTFRILHQPRSIPQTQVAAEAESPVNYHCLMLRDEQLKAVFMYCCKDINVTHVTYS